MITMLSLYPLRKDILLHLNKPESLSYKDALHQVWLKKFQWIFKVYHHVLAIVSICWKWG